MRGKGTSFFRTTASKTKHSMKTDMVKKGTLKVTQARKKGSQKKVQTSDYRVGKKINKKGKGTQ